MTRGAPIIRPSAPANENQVQSAGLYVGVVTHRRTRPKIHALRYRIVSVLVDIDDIAALDARLKLWSHRRFNLFGFDERDHGDGSGGSLRAWAEGHLTGANIDLDGGPIRLLAMPRVLGYAFNPISLWFCHRPDGALAAVLYEVHNTFAERHVYVIAVDAEGGAGAVRQACAKSFHVSPFMPMALRYEFRLRAPGERMALTIDVSDAQGLLLTASLAARRTALSDAALLRAFLSTPLLSLKVIGAIHLEALRLWIKGLRLYPHPRLKPPTPFLVPESNSHG